MKQIILSYDYELFFGDLSGTVERTLIEPTNMLLNLFSVKNIKATFFVDYLMIKRLRTNVDDRSKEDLLLVENQIREIIRQGHRIELHIHPHWVDAKYNGNGTWDFSEFRHYSLNTFSVDEITSMIVEGTNILEEIAKEIDPSYKIVAFRAGGWAIQPVSLLLEGFRKAGIFIDSSVCYGIKNTNLHSAYDFTTVPNSIYYRFSDSINCESSAGDFFEFPITSYYRLILYKVLDRASCFLNKKSRPMTDGTHARSDEVRTNKITLFNRAMVNTTCVSTLTALLSILCSRKDLVVIIDHPKDMTLNTIDTLSLLSKVTKSTTYFDYYNNCIK